MPYTQTHNTIVRFNPAAESPASMIVKSASGQMKLSVGAPEVVCYMSATHRVRHIGLCTRIFRRQPTYPLEA